MAVDFVSPSDVVGAAAAFFGGSINLDPASSDNANTVVNADRYYTIKENGITQNWKAKSIYLYPPRDFLDHLDQPKNNKLFSKQTKFKKSAQRVWLELAIHKYRKQEYEEGLVFLTSTDVALITTQKLELDLPICVLKERPKLRTDDYSLTKLQSVRCHGFILYIPTAFNTEKRILKFREIFSYLGRIYM
jgi:hypothetical protein